MTETGLDYSRYFWQREKLRLCPIVNDPTTATIKRKRGT